jgi:hypothetical protein
MSTTRRVLGTGLVWSVVWIAAAIILILIIGVVDPDSIDPGEGPLVAAAIFGPMGFMSGVAFAILSTIGDRGRTKSELSVTRAARWGFLGTAIAQLVYLNHGDLGLVSNIKMALMFSAFGGAVAMVWLVTARRLSKTTLSKRAGL